MKIAVYGGTFNPIHNGHINLALCAIEQLSLDKLILIPDNIPPHKPIPNGATNDNRFNMCCIVAKNYDKIEVSDIEINKKGTSYTIDTLIDLKKIYKNDDLYLLIGSDMFFSFLSWKNPFDILNIAKLYVMPRKENELQEIEEKVLYFKSKGIKIGILNIKPYEVSSTLIRKKVFLSEDISNLIPKDVEKYIIKNRLYKKGE